ncbi:DUF6538 domain-containing protein [Pseudomonas aeruginosa]|uniref:DUF6538 domain-containing protein n=1 Tax=Pseudomonas aeruginosa TaxID=287 RepID=UPI003AAB5B13
MKPSPSYLTISRHGTYYFRAVIPRPLRTLFNGQREIRRTLKTDSQRLARKRARQYAARFEAACDKVMSVTKRDELGFSDADYLEMMELEMKGLFPDFSSPKDDSQPAEPILSNEEIEARQRRQEVARLLTGSHGRLRSRVNKRRWLSNCWSSPSRINQPSYGAYCRSYGMSWYLGASV